MKRLIIISNLIFLLFTFSLDARANNRCDNLNFSFNVMFEINNSEHNETVWLNHKHGDYTALWTDDENISNRIVWDKSIRKGGLYRIYLKFESWHDLKKNGYKKRGRNKSGLLHYYHEENGKWVRKGSVDVNLPNGTTSMNLTSSNVSGFQCLGEDEPPATPIIDLANYCDLFPGPAQTWKFNPTDSLYIANGATINGTKNVDGQHFVGFTNLSGQNLANGCDNNRCYSDNGLLVEPVRLGDFPTLPYASYPVNGNTTFTESEHKILGAVTVNRGAVLTMSSGTYWNDSMNILGKVVIPKDQKVVIHTKALALSQKSEFMIEDGASLDNLKIFVHDKVFTSQTVIHPRVDFSEGSKFRGLLYSERQTELSNNVNYYGAITALYINMHNNSKIHGDSACFSPPVQDNNLSVTPLEDLSLICERQPVEFQVTKTAGGAVTDYSGQVIVTTKEAFPSGKAYWYLTETGGEDNKRDISKEHSFDVDSSGKIKLWLKSDYVGNIEVTGKLSTDNNRQTVGNYQFVPFKLEIQHGELKTVANKPRDISIVAKACSDGSDDDSIADGYIGTRTLKLVTEYAEPKSGSASIFLKDKDDNWTSNEGKFEFKAETNQDGTTTVRARSVLKYADAGTTQLTFYDPNCTRSSCDIKPIARMLKAKKSSLDDWERLEGVQAVATRPYTFALCNNGDTAPLIENASGTSEVGNGFVAAGEVFGLKVKPVVWTEDDGNDDIDGNQNAKAPVDSSGMCGRQATPNFYVGGAPKATIALSIPGDKPLTPDKAGAESGSLTSTPLSNTQIENTAFSVSWSEVGSIWLQADTQAPYLGMDVNMGRRPVGRFYPDHFVIKASTLTNAVNNTFTYMDQGFQTSFTVEARNKNNKATNNYGLFNSAFKEELELVAIDSQVTGNDKNDLTPRLDIALLQTDPAKPNYWANNWQQATLTLGSTKLALKRDTAPDGPYPVHLGLYVKQRNNCSTTGCTDFSVKNLEQRVGDGTTPVTAAKLNDDIDARYGRMRLEDVTVPVTQDADVPVMVEYYQSSSGEFILNTDDNMTDASSYGSNHGCSKLIFPEAMKSALANTPASDPVSGGEGRLRVSHPQGTGVTDSYREQIRLGQRLSSAAPACSSGSPATSNQPWLQFDWSGEGDTDPSAVVTFGVYRGNDRIIYRGEKGMNHLLN